MERQLKITILTTKSSWLNQYNVKLAQDLQKLGCSVKIIHNKHDLEEGDIAFFLGCYEIIDTSFLKLHKNNLVVHESDLPQGKGWSPMAWQILEGKNDIPITLFEAVERVDAGDVYIRDVIHLRGDELYEEWRQKQGEKTCLMCLDYVRLYVSGLLPAPQKQTGDSSFYRQRTIKDDEIDPGKSIVSQFNHLRIVDNEEHPAFFIHNNKKYILKIYSGEN
jgi:methionyl-tRNA formyltransferase